MTSFQTILETAILGKLITFDRMIFHGHLTGFFGRNAFKRFLSSQGILLKDFAGYVQKVTTSVKAHLEAIADKAGRPRIYLQGAFTAKKGRSKEDMARKIAEEDGIKSGLVCMFSTLESAWSFDVQGNRKAQKLEVVRKERKCLHYYLYYIDPRFGFMHVRMSTWFPFQVQVYINGREWLGREMDKAGIGYQRYDNTFTQIDNLEAAAALAETFGETSWPGILDGYANQVNPFLATIGSAGFGLYYWCLDQVEIATDIMFKDRASLQGILPDLYDYSIRNFSAEDVMKFLGRKPHPLFQGEVTSDKKKRPEGVRVKHRVKRNSIKMYDKMSVLRIETTINNPRDFKVLKVSESDTGPLKKWVPMGKGVANARRMHQVGAQSNERYLAALAAVEPKGEVVDILDDLCRPHKIEGRPVARLNLITPADCAIFLAVMAGEHIINGFRNHDITARLHPKPSKTREEEKRRCAKVSRLIRKLRDHGLISKVPSSRMYRITDKGYRAMSAVLRFRNIEFPTNYRTAA